MTDRLADEAHSVLGANPLILRDAAAAGPMPIDAAVVVGASQNLVVNVR